MRVLVLLYVKCLNYYRINGLTAFIKIVCIELKFIAFYPFKILEIENYLSEKKSILIVSHQASRTGAPILALNLANKFQNKYNIFILVLSGGVLSRDFRSIGACNVEIIDSKILSVSAGIQYIKRLSKNVDIDFAIVNSIESRSMLRALSILNITTLTLVHEFYSSVGSRDAFLDVYNYSNKIVFPALVVMQDYVEKYPFFKSNKIHIIPQGKCVVSRVGAGGLNDQQVRMNFKELIRPSTCSSDVKVILGAGYVHYRKGVDLFLECAAKIIESPDGENYRFVWVGGGYLPEIDLNYSRFLKDQLNRAGLIGQFLFIDETPHIDIAYEEADLFLLTSRLDPLPNVAIDAMFHNLPVLCFDKTTGFADLLKENDLGEACVADYLDVDDLSQKAIDLLTSQSFYSDISNSCFKVASNSFDMNKYVEGLERLVSSRSLEVEREKDDFDTINLSGLYNIDYAKAPNQCASQDVYQRTYVRAWSNRLGCRKPFPGFHPGIYLEKHGVDIPLTDPLADFIRNGMPEGPWIYHVVSNNTPVIVGDIPNNGSVALHIHVYYMDLFPDIMKCLDSNNIKPDLFISVPNPKVKEQVLDRLDSYKGNVIEVEIVPNRGRDIGPLLTLFGERILNNYEFVGHIHTKKTNDIKDNNLIERWRNFLMLNMLGDNSFGMADAILSKLNTNSDIGIIFPDDPNAIGWDKNKNDAVKIANEINIKHLPENFLFPVGAMFWARTKALEDMINRKFTWDDYPDEPLPYDGTILHALERLLGFPSNDLKVAASWMIGTSR